MTSSANVRADAIREASRPLFEEMALKPGQTFTLRSRSREGQSYEMTVTPDGRVVHLGEGCEGEKFSGVGKCWHCQESEKYMTTREMARYEGAQVPVQTFSSEDVSVLKQTIAKGVTDAELSLFIATCKHTGLDPFLKQIYAIKRKTNEGTRENPRWVEVMSIQVGIDGYRLIAERTGEMEGIDGPQWSADGKEWLDAWYANGNPRFARVGIWRKGVPRAFIAVCRWDAYNQDNSMWRKMGPEQLAKCAEALAYRRAFPAEMAGLPTQPDYIDIDELQTERQSVQSIPGAWDNKRIEPPAAIDGEVVHETPSGSKFSPNALPDEHEATQETPVSASDGSTATTPVQETSPASSPALMDEEQHAKVIEWVETIKDRHGAKPITQTGDWLKAAFPHCVGDNNGRPNIGALTQTDTASYIRLLRHVAASKDGAVPAEGAEPEHEYVLQGESPDPVCLTCGLVYEEEVPN